MYDRLTSHNYIYTYEQPPSLHPSPPPFPPSPLPLFPLCHRKQEVLTIEAEERAVVAEKEVQSWKERVAELEAELERAQASLEQVQGGRGKPLRAGGSKGISKKSRGGTSVGKLGKK